MSLFLLKLLLILFCNSQQNQQKKEGIKKNIMWKRHTMQTREIFAIFKDNTRGKRSNGTEKVVPKLKQLLVFFFLFSSYFSLFCSLPCSFLLHLSLSLSLMPSIRAKQWLDGRRNFSFVYLRAFFNVLFCLSCSVFYFIFYLQQVKW